MDQDPELSCAWNPKISKLLTAIPICQGSNGIEDRSIDWHVAGTGRQLKKIREWIEQDSLPDDWEKKLGQSFIQEMLDTEWEFYQCPSCDSFI